jgi:hypothetical protein
MIGTRIEMPQIDPQETAWMNRVVVRVMSVLWLMLGSVIFAVGAHVALGGDQHDLKGLINKGIFLGPLTVYFAIYGIFTNSSNHVSQPSRTPGRLLRKHWLLFVGCLVFEAVVLTAWTMYLHQHGFPDVWTD